MRLAANATKARSISGRFACEAMKAITNLVLLHGDKHLRSVITHQRVILRQRHCFVEQVQGGIEFALPLFDLVKWVKRRSVTAI